MIKSPDQGGSQLGKKDRDTGKRGPVGADKQRPGGKSQEKSVVPSWLRMGVSSCHGKGPSLDIINLGGQSSSA